MSHSSTARSVGDRSRDDKKWRKVHFMCCGIPFNYSMVYEPWCIFVSCSFFLLSPLYLTSQTWYFTLSQIRRYADGVQWLNKKNQAVKVSPGGSFVGLEASHPQGDRSPRRYVVSPRNNSNRLRAWGLVPMQFELVFCSPPPLGAKKVKKFA